MKHIRIWKYELLQNHAYTIRRGVYIPTQFLSVCCPCLLFLFA